MARTIQTEQQTKGSQIPQDKRKAAQSGGSAHQSSHKGGKK